MLSPHGHWKFGRFRPDQQHRCAQFARLGFVVFSYDMIGFGFHDEKNEWDWDADSRQMGHSDSKVLVMQFHDSIRSLDFLYEYVEVILGAGEISYKVDECAVSGASRGATRTFYLAAVDNRVDISIPVGMVSSEFYGGCVCESGLPVHSNNKTKQIQ